MKYYFTFLFLLIYFTSSAQLIAKFQKDTILVSRLLESNVTPRILIDVAGLNPEGGSNIINVSVLSGAAQIYRLSTPSLVATTNMSQLEFEITINRGSNAQDKIELVKLQLSYNSGVESAYETLVLKIQNQHHEDEKTSFFNRFTYLNAYNFDFNGKLKSNYVGMFKIYVPAPKQHKWGVIGGIMNINYELGASSDSLSYNSINYHKINPLDTLIPGRKFVRQYNTYTVTYTNSISSAFGQGLFLLNKHSTASPYAKVYFHGHFEFTITRLTRMTKMNTLQTDTPTLGNPFPRNLVVDTVKPANEQKNKFTYYDGYFGIGLTFDISVTKASALFLQCTFGYTTNFPSPASVPDFGARSEVRRTRNDWTKFYLFKAAFTYWISDASQLVICQDIRGLFPRYNPLAATFIGLNIKIEKIFDLIR